MLGQIRRHQKWLWVIIAGLTIISFVYFLDPTTGRRGGAGIFSGGGGAYAYINGQAVSAKEFEEMKQEAKLAYLFSTGRWPEEDETGRQLFDPDRRTLERIFLVEKANELNIRVADDAVAEWIANNPNFRGRNGGGFQIEAFQQFASTVLPRGRVSQSDFNRFVRHEIAIEQMYALGGVSGDLVTPREAGALYRQENEQLLTEVVTFSASNYLASVQTTPAALAQFYTNNMAQYRIPERLQVSYVKFDLTNFLAEADQHLTQITNLTQRLEAIYQQNGPDFYKDADGKPLTQDAAIQKIKDEQREQIAKDLASKKAFEFMQQLYDLYQKEPKQPDNLDRLAAATGYQSATTQPFTRFEGPKELKVPDTFAQAAFALTPETPMASDPIVGEDAVYAVVLKARIPSEVPPLDAVREKVVEDFRRHEAIELARKAGQTFYNTLTNGFAQNKSFQAVCLEAGVISHKLPPFSLSTRSLPKEWEDRLDLSLLKDVASSLSPGKTGRFEMTRDGGLIVHLLSRQPVDDPRLKAELPEFTDRLRAQRHRQALGEWLGEEFKRAHVTLASSQEKKSTTE